MKATNKLIILCVLFSTIITFHSFGQTANCKTTEKIVQDVLDSRKGKPTEYGENVTTGVAYLLALECDSAIYYFTKADQIFKTEAVNNIISALNGNSVIVDNENRKTSTENVPEKNEGNTRSYDNSSKIKKEAPRSSSSSNVGHPTESTNSTKSVNNSEIINNSFSQKELDDFQQKGLLKVQKLADYLGIISDKLTNETKALSAIERSIELFDSENHSVQVSSLSRVEIVKMPLRTYLNRLRMLNYQKVKIEGASFTYVSNFKRGPDGNFYGIARFRQLFTGYIENKPMYSDITTKTVAVVLKPYQKDIEGKSVEQWDVFLGDISVAQTEHQ